MSKMRRKRVVKELKAAKKHLAHKRDSDKTDYICHAINDGLDPNWRTRANPPKSDARKIIMGRLGGFETVASWLESNVPNIAFNDLQAYRHRWVDALIKEFSA